MAINSEYTNGDMDDSIDSNLEGTDLFSSFWSKRRQSQQQTHVMWQHSTIDIPTATSGTAIWIFISHGSGRGDLPVVSVHLSVCTHSVQPWNNTL